MAELRRGHFGPACYQEVRRVAGRVVRFGHYPSPEGSGWTGGAIDDLVQGFLAARDRPARLVRAAQTVADEHALGLLLERMIKNHLADRARQTEVGKLHRRLRHVLAGDGRFLCVNGDAWALREKPTAETWAGRQDDLVRAAWGAVQASPIRERRRPARTALLADLCHAVVDKAAAAVPVGAMSAAAAHALGVAPSGSDSPAADTHLLPAATNLVPSPGPARAIAGELWARLGDR
ncbi:MAG: hypothetical protein M3144_08100, partial [Actinomycetota bacterium]|nr:hypothetical protein [Actinomycetota bacterium]